jgi:hypothetical protein
MVYVYHREALPRTAGQSHGTEEADWGSVAEVILHFLPCKGQMEEGPCPSENDASV